MGKTAPDKDVPKRVFDSVLESGVLAIDETIRTRLLQSGYDGEASSYPLHVWRGVQEQLRAHFFSELEEQAGYRELGRRFTEGFGRTTVGIVFKTVAPLFGPDRTILALKRYLSVVRSEMGLTITGAGANRYLAVFEDAMPLPDFIAGAIEGILLTFKVAPKVEVTSRSRGGFELDISWVTPSTGASTGSSSSPRGAT